MKNSTFTKVQNYYLKSINDVLLSRGIYKIQNCKDLPAIKRVLQDIKTIQVTKDLDATQFITIANGFFQAEGFITSQWLNKDPNKKDRFICVVGANQLLTVHSLLFFMQL